VRLSVLTAAALSVALWLPAVAPAEDLTIYSSLPLAGSARAQAQDVVRAEQLALEQNGNRAGAFSVRFVSLDDASAKTGAWTPLRTVMNARRAAEDPTTIAYPPAAQAFYAAFRARYGKEAEPYALQGYEAMSVTLDAIRRAGAKGNDRASVIAAFRATTDRDSVLGRYSIDPNGDTTLSTYGVLRIGPRGRLVYDRTIDSGARV
jgi:ABC-type branched-subunit amino acid transport system substrate-binding protein